MSTPVADLLDSLGVAATDRSHFRFGRRPLLYADSKLEYALAWRPGPRTPCEAAWRIADYRNRLSHLAERNRLGPITLYVKVNGALQPPARFEVCEQQLTDSSGAAHRVVVVRDSERGTVFTGHEASAPQGGAHAVHPSHRPQRRASVRSATARRLHR